MKRILILAMLVLMCSSSVAFGYVIGKSNFGFQGYPKFTDKHYRPTKPYSKDTYSIERYRWDVQAYVNDAKDYVDAANNDINRIKESIDNAITEANSVVDEYNRFMRQGY